MTKDYPKIMKHIEEYCQYCLRVLHRAGIHPTPSDFALLSFTRKNGRLSEALIYPANSVTETTIKNPLFFYGFKADYDFSNLEYPVKITFSEDYEVLYE